MTQPRKPTAFALDDSAIQIAPPLETEIPAHTTPVAGLDETLPPPKSSTLGRIFWAGLTGLVSLGVGLSVTRLVEDLFTRNPVLGWIGLGAAGLTALAALILLIRELWTLRRLNHFDALRQSAERAMATHDDHLASEAASGLISLLAKHPRTASGRNAYATATADTIMDGRDRLRLAEREILEPLDREATRIVAEAARRVSLVTALSPRAAIDLAIVFFTTLRLIRQIADLYGGRPGTLGQWRLLRHVLSHMAVTGGMAAGDTLLEQIMGQGLAAKLSAKLGEGVLNGLMTARLGLVTIALTRPLPYLGAPKPDIRDFARDLFGKGEKG